MALATLLFQRVEELFRKTNWTCEDACGEPLNACIIFEFTVDFNYCRGGNERLMIINDNW